MGLKSYALILLCLVFAVGFESTLAPTVGNDVIPYLDKIAHFCAFGFMAYLVANVWVNINPQASLWGVVVLVALLSVGNEWIQSFTPARMTEAGDVLAGMFGGLVCLVVYGKWG